MTETIDKSLKDSRNDVPLCLAGASVENAPNEKIVLADNSELRLTPSSDENKEIIVKGDIIQRFQPKPRLIVKINEAVENSLDYLGNGEVLDISINGLGLKCRVTNIQRKSSEKTKVTLSSINDQLLQEVIGNISYATFNLVNFPFCLGNGIRGRNNSQFYWKGRLEFGDVMWSITIDKLENHKSLKENLSNEGGFAITHAGQISMVNHQLFTSAELDEIRKVLYEFLSFTRGARAAPINFRGFNEEDEEIWKDWSLPRVDRWTLTQNNWFSDQHAFEQLHSLFTEWSKLFDHSLWKNELPKIIYWYNYAGRNTDGAGTDGSLILAVAALELVSFNYLVRYKQIRNEATFKSKDLHNNVYNTLKELEIPTELPKKLSNLHQYAMNKNWQNGPKACIETRNEVVHPDRNSEPGSWTCYDALQLSLWYIEMMILKMCEYEGIYSNRLHRQKWRGTVETVPWGLGKL